MRRGPRTADLDERQVSFLRDVLRPDGLEWRNLLRRLIVRLRAVASLLPELGGACHKWAEQLEALADALDCRDASWSDMQEAE